MSRTDLTNLPTIAFIGAGAMGGALVRGLLNADARVGPRIRITGQWTEQVQELTDLYGVQGFDTTTDPEANIKAVDGAGVVVIAVKPDVTPEVLKGIAGAVRDGAVIISIAAGVTIETTESLLPGTVSVIRVMPNAPALVGRGVTGISAGTRGTIQDVALAGRLFRTVGTVLTIPETLIDEVTSISGYGPAYVFFLIEKLDWPFVEVFPSRLASDPQGLAGALRQVFLDIGRLEHAVVFIDEVEEIASARTGEASSPLQGSPTNS